MIRLAVNSFGCRFIEFTNSKDKFKFIDTESAWNWILKNQNSFLNERYIETEKPVYWVILELKVQKIHFKILIFFGKSSKISKKIF